MDLDLSSVEQRVLGVLIEKEKTTPEQYPLSLNALTNGCNQKSNREPVMSLSENAVQDACNLLVKKHLVRIDSSGARVLRYQHRFCNSDFSKTRLNEQQLALMCLLFLRGPQTPGELRSRSNRLTNFNSVSDVEASLQSLIHLEPAFVRLLAREPGKRESRYQHCLGEQAAHPSPPATLVVETAVPTGNDDKVSHDKITRLEERVAKLEDALARIMKHLNLEDGE